MAGQPLAKFVKATLAHRAEVALGIVAEDRASADRAALEYVCAWTERGGTERLLASSIVEETGIAVSGDTVKLVSHRLERKANASGCVAAARAAHAESVRDALIAEARQLFGFKSAALLVGDSAATFRPETPAATTPSRKPPPSRPITIDDLRRRAVAEVPAVSARRC